MKNIHVLPTDKPSRLFYNVGGALLFTNYENRNGVNIYITSDEEIKEKDWFLNKISMKPYKHIWDEYFNNIGEEKIILTTDQDLIKDGVHAIDNEFLEWFVKNPSCGDVEIEDISMQYHEEGYYEYKIIIPKEDWLLNNPQCKQIESCSKSLSKKCICTKEEPTLEEEYLKDELKKYDGIDVVVLNKPEEPKQETLEDIEDLYLMKNVRLWLKTQQDLADKIIFKNK